MSLVGLGSPDDALVYALDDDHALVQTVDFSRYRGRPYAYGAIAAANAVSDIMLWAALFSGTQLSGFRRHVLDTLAEILRAALIR